MKNIFLPYVCWFGCCRCTYRVSVCHYFV
jgi:hypothetical protein